MTTKTKPQTKQEMDEWLAENVLKLRANPDGAYQIGHEAVEDWLKTPDGFFAVWNAVEKAQYFVGMEMYIPPDEELQGEAFYNAVYEAWE